MRVVCVCVLLFCLLCCGVALVGMLLCCCVFLLLCCRSIVLLCSGVVAFLRRHPIGCDVGTLLRQCVVVSFSCCFVVLFFSCAAAPMCGWVLG